MSNEELYLKFQDQIDIELNKRKYKWHLTAIPSVSYEDICQIIRRHIFIKINTYDPTKSDFSHWVNTVISNQIINELRNHWGNTCSPCNFCKANEGEDLCSIYTTKSVACPLYRKWNKSKRYAHEIKLPASLDLHSNELSEKLSESLDIDKTEKQLHAKMLEELASDSSATQVYRLLYIEKKNDQEVCDILGYNTKNGVNRQFKIIQKRIINLAKKIMVNKEIDFVYV